jgi:hypothetical protein
MMSMTLFFLYGLLSLKRGLKKGCPLGSSFTMKPKFLPVLGQLKKGNNIPPMDIKVHDHGYE